MTLTDYGFPLFAAVLLMGYYILPGKWQQWLLLLASIWFCLLSGAEGLVFLAVTVLSTYFAALAIGRSPDKRAKHRWLTGWMLLNLGMLTLCKASRSGLPLGISFYTFQSLGYLLDVSRGTAEPERMVSRLGLFLSFFPQLVQGPISRFGSLAPQLTAPHPFDAKQVSLGCQRMLWGYFKKLVIADRLAPAVAAMKNMEPSGTAFALLSLYYAVQIYADFTGGIDITLGFCQALGIQLPENFRHPFGSRSIAEYWRRWHITLGSWMKDYLFYPISISKPLRKAGKALRKRFPRFGRRFPVYAATVVTWAATGIWHGLTPNFLLWGMLNCGVILLSGELSPLYDKFHRRFPVKQTRWFRGFQIIRTFALMNLIRACDLFPNVGDYFVRLGTLVAAPGLSLLWDGTLLTLGLSALDYGILLFGCGLMTAVSLLQQRRGSVGQWLLQAPDVLRWSIHFLLFLLVLLLGCHGIGYDSANFIYNQF